MTSAPMFGVIGVRSKVACERTGVGGLEGEGGGHGGSWGGAKIDFIIRVGRSCVQCIVNHHLDAHMA